MCAASADHAGQAGLAKVARPGWPGQASLDQYLVCQQDHGVDCTYLSPPADLFAGERTGSYRLGRDELLLDAQGRSRISMEDFVVALLDEIELSRFRNQRFTVAY